MAESTHTVKMSNGSLLKKTRKRDMEIEHAEETCRSRATRNPNACGATYETGRVNKTGSNEQDSSEKGYQTGAAD